MGVWSVLFMSAMPVFRLLVHCGIGAYLSSPESNVLPPDARKYINKLVFICFMPSLVFSNLAQTVTVEKMLDWWFMPLNVLLCYVIGAGIGICIYDYYKPPPHLRKLIIACCATGNSSNLPLVLISAICVEAGSPFGNFDVCLANGIAYVSYGLWMSTVLTWTVVFNFLKPEPGEVHEPSLESTTATAGQLPSGSKIPAQLPVESRAPGRQELSSDYRMPARQDSPSYSGFQLGYAGGIQGFQGGYQLESRLQSSPGYMTPQNPLEQPQDFSRGYQASQRVPDFQGFQTPQGFPQASSSSQDYRQDYRQEYLGGAGAGFQSSEDYIGGGFQSFPGLQGNRPRGLESERFEAATQGQGFTNPQGFLSASYPHNAPEPRPYQGFQVPQPRMLQNEGFQRPAFPDTNDRFQDRSQAFQFQPPPAQFQPLQVPGQFSQPVSRAREALHGSPEVPIRLDDLSIANMKLLAERWRLKEAFTPPTTAAAIAIPVGAVPFFRHLLYGHQAPFRFIGDALSILGEAMIPCMNLLLGGNLSQGFGASELAQEVVICVMLTRLVLLPMAGLIVVKLAFSMGLVPADPLFHFVLLLQFTMPTAINIGTMTQLFGAGQTESSIILFWCYSSSVIFLTLWTMIFLVLLI